jgi:hypothetical protein
MTWRLCTANDLTALREQLANGTWEQVRHGTMDDKPWTECGKHWQYMFRLQADGAIRVLHSDSLPLPVPVFGAAVSEGR